MLKHDTGTTAPDTRRIAPSARLALMAAAAALLGITSAVSAEQSIAVVGGTLIDGKGGPPIPEGVVVIDGSTIKAVGTAASTPVPDGARIVRADGKFVLPGLIDSHMHIGGSGGGSADKREFTPEAGANNFKSYLIFGVTTVFDIAGNPFIDQQKSALDSGKMVGPRLFGTKYGVTSPGAHPMGLLEEYHLVDLLGSVYPQIDTIDAARAAVRKIAADKSDGLKIFHSRAEFPGTSRIDADKEKFRLDVLKALVEEAHANGLRVFVHITFPSEAREAVEAGVDALAHSISMSETGTDEIFKAMAERGVYYIPTLAQFEAIYALKKDPFFLEALRGKVWGVILDSMTLPNSVVRARLGNDGLIAQARHSLRISTANLRRALRAGVKVAMGTDSGNAGTIHGATVPREMELMVAAGMTPMEVIVASTANAAEAIGQSERLGTLEPGKLADVILVGGDVLSDIGNIRKVELVIRGGRVIDTAGIKFD